MFLIFLSLPGYYACLAQDYFTFSGQFSTGFSLNSAKVPGALLPSRYIPRLNYTVPGLNSTDIELSVNGYAGAVYQNTRTPEYTAKIKPYRIWLRYSGEQYEIRAGLQKINFGSASMLRPLMWFDKIDPRDPLQLTDGVWGLLTRYYFIDNTNVWLWGLYGNSELKTWEFIKTLRSTPEFGGRIQSPLLNGEAAITYHFRKTDLTTAPLLISTKNKSSEHRIGIDGKWDYEAGIWIESAFIFRDAEMGILRNQELITAGLDYTIGLGNGLNISAEHLLSTAGEKPAQFSNKTDLTALSFSYPISISDQITFISYYDWKRNNSYNFLNWQLIWDNTSLSVMAFSNPAEAPLPQQSGNTTSFSGAGFQLLYIYNH
ncbi:MAG: hypothetical protein HUU54_13830 [Ignavibacteriaceae bacterium]|nr:hypothetical protein [Ignavibacteriaceae bacterium]